MTPTSFQPDPAFVRLNDLTVRAAYEPILRKAGLDSIAALFACPGETTFDKPGLGAWRARLRVTVAGDDESRTLYLKRYDHPPVRARREAAHCGIAAHSVAGVEWNWIREFSRAGIPCVDAVAFGEALAGSRELRSVLVTAELPGDALERIVRTWTDDTAARARGVLPVLATLVATMHDAGFVHRDLYLSHVFFDPGAPVAESLRLLDLQRVKRPAWNLTRWIVKDLAALNYSTPQAVASLADRVRWLKCYLRRARLDPAARRLLYRVVGKTRQIARHDAARERRLYGGHERP